MLKGVPMNFNQHFKRLELIEFKKHVQSMLEPDYGDFMRAANHDLLKLIEAFKTEDETVQDKLNEMQMYTQFQPSWKVESTRERLLLDSEVLNILIKH
jgi:hypothetical protein